MRRWKASLILLLVILFGPVLTMGESRNADPESQLLRLSEAIMKAKTEARYEAEQTVYAFTRKKTVVTRFRVRYAYPFPKKGNASSSSSRTSQKAPLARSPVTSSPLLRPLFSAIAVYNVHSVFCPGPIQRIGGISKARGCAGGAERHVRVDLATDFFTFG
jgi:hypothetical protein